MLAKWQEAIRRSLGLPGLEECGSVFGRWLERATKYGNALILLVMLVWFLLYFSIESFLKDANSLESILIMVILCVAILLVLLDFTALECFFKNPKKSEYYLATGVTRKDIVNDKGALGEFYAYVLSQKLTIPHKTLYNVCIPMPNGNYQEIDAIIITNNWIYVLECKNRAGYFTGNFKSEIWVQHIGNEEHRVKNIYKQNQEHIFALECLLKSKEIIPSNDVYCVNDILTGGELRLDMGDSANRPAEFGFGDYNSLKGSILRLEKKSKEDRGKDFMEKVYRALLPYSLFDKQQRASMLSRREYLAEQKEFVRGNYRYYEFPNGVPGVTTENTLLRQDKVFTQVNFNINQEDSVWITIPHIRYVENK